MGDQVYTREQRIQAMKAAGWPTDIIPVGVAVSLAESWNGQGINNNPPVEYSVGPWQINLLAHHNISESQAQDLNYSTAYALKLWEAQGFNPWGAFTNGSYLKFLESPTNATGDNKLDPGTSSASATAPKTATTSGVAGSGKLNSFAFPTLDLGAAKVDSNPLFKIALTIGALFLLFYGIKTVVE